MKPEFDTDKSIYLQIAESIEDDILQEMIEEETQVPSTNQLAVMYRINPATAAKGINMLGELVCLFRMERLKKSVPKEKQYFTINTLSP